MSDGYWLGKYLEDGSEAAFRTLVDRHLDLVYATAHRRLGNQALAQDASQNVFVMLARKAGSLRDRTDLSGWLYKAALLKAREIAREEARRRKRESQAVLLGTAMEPDDSLLKPLIGELDEAMLELREKDRQALLLRFSENRSLRSVGGALGVSEDAAQKRVAAALELLARAFRKRGYTAAGSGAVVAALRGTTQAAPSGLLAVVSRAAVEEVAGVSMFGAGTFVAKIMSLSKAQTAVLCLLLSAGPIAFQSHSLSTIRAEQDFWRRQYIRERGELSTVEAEQSQTKRRLDKTRTSTSDLGWALDRRRAAGRTDSDASVYRWSEDSGYVRVPKSILSKIDLAEVSKKREEVGNSIPIRPVVREDGTVNDLAIEVLDLTTNQAAALKTRVADFSRDFKELARRNSVFTNAPTDIPILDGDSKTLRTFPFPEEGALLEEGLHRSLREIVGRDRADIFWQQARSDFLYRFNDFGRAEKTFTLVKNPNFGFCHVFGAVRENGRVTDYRSGVFNVEELRPESVDLWPDLRTVSSKPNFEQQ